LFHVPIQKLYNLAGELNEPEIYSIRQHNVLRCGGNPHNFIISTMTRRSPNTSTSCSPGS
jgi:hypothetical protein